MLHFVNINTYVLYNIFNNFHYQGYQRKVLTMNMAKCMIFMSLISFLLLDYVIEIGYKE